MLSLQMGFLEFVCENIDETEKFYRKISPNSSLDIVFTQSSEVNLCKDSVNIIINLNCNDIYNFERFLIDNKINYKLSFEQWGPSIEIYDPDNRKIIVCYGENDLKLAFR